MLESVLYSKFKLFLAKPYFGMLTTFDTSKASIKLCIKLELANNTTRIANSL